MGLKGHTFNHAHKEGREPGDEAIMHLLSRSDLCVDHRAYVLAHVTEELVCVVRVELPQE